MLKIRSPGEVKDAFQNALAALTASCAGYDAGYHWEAPRLATAVYLLVNDGGRKNQSLVTRLGMKRVTMFLSSGAKIDPKNAFSQPLVSVSLNSERQAVFVPLFGSQPENHRQLRFGEWWERDEIYRNGDTSLTRKRLVFALRNKEGGAHFDHLTDDGYIAVATIPAWTFRPVGGQSHTLHGIERALMRQVAWELLESFRGAEAEPAPATMHSARGSSTLAL